MSAPVQVVATIKARPVPPFALWMAMTYRLGASRRLRERRIQKAAMDRGDNSHWFVKDLGDGSIEVSCHTPGTRAATVDDRISAAKARIRHLQANVDEMDRQLEKCNQYGLDQRAVDCQKRKDEFLEMLASAQEVLAKAEVALPSETLTWVFGPGEPL